MTSLHKQIQELKEKIAKGDEEELPANDSQVEEAPKEEPVKEEPEETEEPKAEPKVETQVEAKTEPEDQMTPSEFARLRRELRELKKEMAEGRKPGREEPESQPEGEQVELPPVLREMVQDYQMNLAGQELNRLEDEVKREYPDYDDVSRSWKIGLYQHTKMVNQRMSDDQVLKETNRKILEIASNYYRDGLNPAVEMYRDAKVSYRPAPKEEPKPVKEEPKPDLKKIAENKERNSGMAGAAGYGGRPDMTIEMAASLSPAEWRKIPASEKKRLLGGR